mmetsp:Transcript_13222/g.26072  ORF Transcript_13222/g.26072 Transcript_13222/m.26072 type:complete len:118 (+) Transcript_13222:673-1026(+)
MTFDFSAEQNEGGISRLVEKKRRKRTKPSSAQPLPKQPAVNFCLPACLIKAEPTDGLLFSGFVSLCKHGEELLDVFGQEERRQEMMKRSHGTSLYMHPFKQTEKKPTSIKTTRKGHE